MAPSLDGGKRHDGVSGDDDLAIRGVVIVGGGAAGWLTALFLQRFMDSRLDITVVAPADIHPLTVGESTNGPFTGLLSGLGIGIPELVNHCDATMKVASEFAEWSHHPLAYKWIHEFEPVARYLGIPLFHFWYAAARRGETNARYQDACSHAAAVVESCRAPFPLDREERLMPHGYHLDGAKFVRLLRSLARKRGVKIIERRITSVVLNPAEHIRHLTFDDAGTLEGDLFIDCSGTKSVVRNLAYGSKVDSFSDYLLCDSAVAVTLPRNSNNIRPSTLATALEAGWLWDIPLSDRTSYGYVFSSAHLAVDAAVARLREVTHASEASSVTELHWAAGMQRKAWINNCVTIGLANSFVEPIESLTSATLTAELHNLLVLFPDKTFYQPTIDAYNRATRKLCENNRDFISVHYATAGRRDTAFWRDVADGCSRSETVKELLESYVEQAPYTVDGIYDTKAFFGMFSARGIFPRRELPLVSYVDRRRSLAMMEDIHATSRRIAQEYPTHADFLKTVRQGVAEGGTLHAIEF
jgi:hypothetical protein